MYTHTSTYTGVPKIQIDIFGIFFQTFKSELKIWGFLPKNEIFNLKLIFSRLTDFKQNIMVDSPFSPQYPRIIPKISYFNPAVAIHGKTLPIRLNDHTKVSLNDSYPLYNLMGSGHTKEIFLKNLHSQRKFIDNEFFQSFILNFHPLKKQICEGLIY